MEHLNNWFLSLRLKLVPFFTFKLIEEEPAFPLFEVINITPLLALAPYIAVADASFKTSILPISSGLISLNDPLTCPSINIKGLPEPSKLVPPLKIMDGNEPGRPVPVETLKPGIVPAKACAGFERKPVSKILLSSFATDEVSFELLQMK